MIRVRLGTAFGSSSKEAGTISSFAPATFVLNTHQTATSTGESPVDASVSCEDDTKWHHNTPHLRTAEGAVEVV